MKLHESILDIVRAIVVAFILLFTGLVAFGQGQANVWYFGEGVGLDFNTNPPTILQNGNPALMSATGEGVGSIADASGNLLFYTNGNIIFDRNHNPMPNGSGLNGNGTTTQTGLIIPINGNPNQYFVISTSDGGAVKYVIVDMTLNGGLGDVVIASKGGTNGTTLLASPKAEGALVVPEYSAANVPTNEYWVIFHGVSDNNYYVCKTNGTTVSLQSTQPIGFVVPGQPVMIMKTNSCFDKIANVFYNAGRVEVMSFNNVTGVISAPSVVLAGTPTPFLNVEVYGVEFSPNGRFLYVSEAGLNSKKTVYQFDLTAGSVAASRVYFTGDGAINRFGSLQLGPDGKIYFPAFDYSPPTYMNVIANPDVKWTLTTPTVADPSEILMRQYYYNGFNSFAGGSTYTVGEGLPPVLKNLLTQITIYYNNACEGGTTNFSYVFGGAASSISWDFGDPASGVLNTSSSGTPSHVYTTAGTYTVTLTIIDNCGRTRTGTVDVIVKSGPTYSLPGTTCPNTNIVITGTGANATNYTWSTSATGTPVLGTGSTYTYNGPLPATVYVQDPTPLATYIAGNTTASQTAASDVGDTQFLLSTTATLSTFQAITRATGSTTITIERKTGATWPGTTLWTFNYTSPAAGTTVTFTPNITLTPGTYRIVSTNKAVFFRNNSSNGTDINGVVDMIGDSDGGTKGGSYLRLTFNLPDPCGIRAIYIPVNCCVPPTITTQPVTQTVCAGTAVNFTVATSAASPTYQWQLSTDNGVTWNDIGGATSNSYSIAAGSVTTAISNYKYRVIVSASSCNATSSVATLTVNGIPAVTNTPLTTTVCEGTAWAGLTLTSSIPSTTFSWTSSAMAGITGNTASGGNTIPSQTFGNSNTTSGTVTYAITPTANSCPGTPVNYVVTVNPLPTVTNTPLTTSVCEGTAWSGLTLTGDVAGTTFSWTSSATAGITGNTASGGNTIPSQTFNTSNTTSGTVTYAITPTSNSCPGTPVNYVVTVNPVPTVTNTPLTATVCEGNAWAGVTLTSDVAGATFSWTSSATAGITGNTASGGNTIPSQTFSNSNTTSGTVTYAITPTANSCPGTPVNYVVTVNPVPTVTNTPLTATVCEGNAWAGVTLTSDVAGATFSWTSSATAGITGNTASGGNTIPSQTFSNSNTTSGTVTYVITPTANGCPGTPVNYVVTVNSVPSVTNTPLATTVCEGIAWSGLTVTGDVAGTIFGWTSSATAGITGNTASGSGDIPTQTFSNSGTGVGTVTYVITPTANSCPGTPVNYVVTVNPATKITAQPTATTNLCTGAPLSLSVTATGLTLTYQWNLNGSPIAGAISSTYSVPSVTLAHAGTYTVDVIGACGTVISSNAVVNINGVSITTQPSNQGTCIGGNATFTVVATGPGLTYQWQENTGSGFTNIGGAMSSSYTITGATLAMSGYSYQVIMLSNGVCPATSSVATLTVNSGTTINTQPASGDICLGAPLNLSVSASGSGLLTYQWNLNGSPIAGAISSTYSVASATAADAGSYTVDVNSSCGPVTSNAAVVTVNNVTINTQPTAQMNCVGGNVPFSVNATGLNTLSYQWQTNNGTGTFSNIAGQTSSTLTLTSITAGMNGYQYQVIISDNNVCALTSSAATLTVNAATVINTQPSGANLCLGDPLNLNVTASGSGVITYQWNLNGAPIGGANASTYSVASVGAANAGSYTVDVSSSCGNITSNAAVVNVNGATISAQPVAQITCEGSNVTFSVTATGVGTLNYQWQTNNGTGTFSNIAGQTASSLTLMSVTSAMNGYQYQVIIRDNGLCPVTSTAVPLTVDPATVISVQPSGANLCGGNSLNLSVSATGSGTITYQWNLNGAPIGGATSSTYSVASVTTADAGSYTVEVTSSCGTITSNAAIVAVTNPPMNSLVVSGSEICSGNNGSVTIASSEIGIQYEAFIGATSVSSVSSGNGGNLTLSVNASSLSAGSNTITIMAYGCSNVTLTNNATITVLGNPGSISGSNTVCSNATSGLVYSISPVAGASTYTWSVSNGGSIAGGQGTTSVTANLSGTPAVVSVQPATALGLTCQTATLTVNQISAYSGLDNLSLNEDTVCADNNITITINNASAQSYQWTLPSGATVVSQTSTSKTIKFSNAGNFTISVQPVHSCNPTIAALTIDVVILQPPVANAGSDIDLNTFQTITLNGSGSSVGTVYGYEWTSSDPGATISSPNSLSTNIIPSTVNSEYYLTVYTLNDAGCEASDVVNVHVTFAVTIPNVFSPNGDGVHDYFVIQNIQFFPEAILYIYNQWGELIYKSAPGYTEPWDGKRNGQNVSVSAYYYILELNEEGYENMSGDVTIVR